MSFRAANTRTANSTGSEAHWHVRALQCALTCQCASHHNAHYCAVLSNIVKHHRHILLRGTNQPRSFRKAGSSTARALTNATRSDRSPCFQIRSCEFLPMDWGFNGWYKADQFMPTVFPPSEPIGTQKAKLAGGPPLFLSKPPIPTVRYPEYPAVFGLFGNRCKCRVK